MVEEENLNIKTSMKEGHIQIFRFLSIKSPRFSDIPPSAMYDSS